MQNKIMLAMIATLGTALFAATLATMQSASAFICSHKNPSVCAETDILGSATVDSNKAGAATLPGSHITGANTLGGLPPGNHAGTGLTTGCPSGISATHNGKTVCAG
jgi:hypothetical protein